MSVPHLHRRMAVPPARPTIEQVTMLRVRHVRGEGCCEDDMVREVVTYFWPDGEVVFEYDPAPTAPPEGNEAVKP